MLCLICIYDAREGECMYIRQSTGACVVTNIFSGTLKICPNLMTTERPHNIVTDTGCDHGKFLTLPQCF